MSEPSSTEVMDWDDAYRGDGEYEGTLPWNIGEPQPELAAIIKAGKVRGEVLDAGCGHAELALTLAAGGYTVVGVDLSQTAVAAATKAAEDRKLSNATFVQDDVTTFGGFDGRFNTILDSTLFHSLPIEDRDGYQQSVFRAAAPGAAYYILVFAEGAFPDEIETKPNQVDEAELRAVVGKYWEIDEIRPAFIHAHALSFRDAEVQAFTPARDDKGRIKFPAFLLTAHKPG